MYARIRSSLLICTLLSAVMVSAGSEQIRVIYGQDNRQDIYQVADPFLKNLAGSTVALVFANNVRDLGSGQVQLNATDYGKKFGLCPEEPFYDQVTAAYCSGFLVAPDTILTAGHCIRDQARCDETFFVFGFASQAKGEITTVFPASRVVKCKQLIHAETKGDGADFAVAKIEFPMKDIEPLLVRDGNQPAPRTAVTVVGHPMGLPTKVSGGARVRANADGYFVANLDTYSGNSGSAVLNDQTGFVEGILVRGETDFISKGTCRISNVCPDDGCRGEEVTDVAKTFPFWRPQRGHNEARLLEKSIGL